MKKYIIYSLLWISVTFFSCKKNALGGNAVVKGEVKHHAKLIPNATVYIKFNTSEFPGKDVTLYDDKFVADADAKYSFKCYKGEYYLYAVGFDSAEPPPGTVTGGVPTKRVRSNETVVVDVPVYE